MTCEDYFQDIGLLHHDRYVEVDHEPFSERYQRAQRYLDDFILGAMCIGCYEEIKADGSKYVEVVAWQEPVTDRFTRDDRGAYGVFKIYYRQESEESYIPEYAELFAYYDDVPTANDKNNRAVDTYDDAVKLMNSYGKYKAC